MTPTIAILYDEGADGSVPLPNYETAGAAGADIRANLSSAHRAEGMTLAPGHRALVPTGLRMEIPHGFEVQVRPRSGLALNQGLTCLNTPGTIDADYRGQVGVILINLGQEPVTIHHGDRIAQIVVAPVTQARFAVAQTLTDTDRGSSGFGSTGTD
ncbi:MAG: dUTP diphosphatase [Pseudomonadota bacterium]